MTIDGWWSSLTRRPFRSKLSEEMDRVEKGVGKGTLSVATHSPILYLHLFLWLERLALHKGIQSLIKERKFTVNSIRPTTESAEIG